MRVADQVAARSPSAYVVSSRAANASPAWASTGSQGAGGSSASCDGFTPATQDSQVWSGTLADFASQRTGYATGAPTWSPSGTAPESRSFQFTYTLSSATPNTGQDSRAAIAFTWEAQTR